MSANRIFWGLMFLAIGVFVLLGNLGIISESYWIEIWRLWPMLLILWGVSLLIGKNGRSNVLFSVIAAVLMIVAVAGFGWLLNNNHINTADVSATTINEELAQGINRGQLDIKFGAAKLEIASGSAKFAEGKAETFSGINIDRSVSSDLQRIQISQVADEPFFWGNRSKNHIGLKLNANLIYKLNVDTGASQFNFDLEDLRISSIAINGGATSGDIKVGASEKIVDIDIASGASSFNLRVPSNAALKVDNKSGLSGNNLEGLGLGREGNVWKSADYDNSDKKINILFSAGASSLNIERY